MGNMSLGAMMWQQREDAEWERAKQKQAQEEKYALADAAAAKSQEEVVAAVSALLKRVEVAEAKISDALTLMENWDGVQFSQIRDVLTGGGDLR